VAGGSSDAGMESEATADAPTADARMGASCASRGTLSWRARAPLPSARTELSTAVVNGKLYALGGNGGTTTTEVDEYDPLSNTWTTKKPMSTARQNAVVAVVRDKIYVTSGYVATMSNEATHPKTTEVYDPATDTWTSKAPIPEPDPVTPASVSLYLAGAAVGDKIYVVVAGYTQNSDTLVYDTTKDVWSKAPPVVLMPNRPAAVSLDANVYVVALQIGGAAYESRLAVFDSTMSSWTLRAGVPTHRETETIVAWGGLFAIGGWTWGSMPNPRVPVTDVEAYDPAADAWRALEKMPTPRALAAGAVLDDKLYIVGGATGNPGTPVPSAVVEEASCLP
jgi:N-acetylneuraminic acid mutarotase